MLKKEKSDDKLHFYCIFLIIFSPKTASQMKSFSLTMLGRIIYLPSTNHLRAFRLATVLLVSSYRLC